MRSNNFTVRQCIQVDRVRKNLKDPKSATLKVHKVPLKERLCRLKQAMNMMMCCDSNRNCPGKVETLGNADTQAGEGSSGLKEGEDVHGNSPTSKKEVKRVLHPSPSKKLSKEQRDDALKAARAALLKMPEGPGAQLPTPKVRRRPTLRLMSDGCP